MVPNIYLIKEIHAVKPSRVLTTTVIVKVSRLYFNRKTTLCSERKMDKAPEPLQKWFIESLNHFKTEP